MWIIPSLIFVDEKTQFECIETYEIFSLMKRSLKCKNIFSAIETLNKKYVYVSLIIIYF